MSARHRGPSRARLGLELRRSVPSLIVIALGIAASLFAVSFIALRVSPGIAKDTFSAKFAVRDATGVVKGVDEVRVLGIPAGRITKIEMEDGQPVVTVKIQSEFGPLYRDAKAALRPLTALQDMYLDVVDPGTPPAGRLSDDEVLPASRTTTAVGIADVLNVFRSDVRTRLQSLVTELGTGLSDRGVALQAALREVAPLLAAADRATRQIAARAPMTRRLVHNTEVLTQELERSQRQLASLVRDGGATLRTLQDGAGDLDATLRGVPPTLAALTSSFTQVRAVLGDVNTAVGDLRPVARALPTALTGLRRLGQDATPAVRALQDPVRRLLPVVRDLLPITSDLKLAVAALEPQLSAADKLTRNLVTCEKGIQGFFQWNASMSKFGDVRGPVPRGNVVAGAQSTGVLNDPGEFAPQACTPGTPIGGRPPQEKDGH